VYDNLTKTNFRDSLVERSLLLMNGLIIAPVMNEIHFNGAFLSLASNIGLFAGALSYSLGCDIWGRRYGTEVKSLDLLGHGAWRLSQNF